MPELTSHAAAQVPSSRKPIDSQSPLTRAVHLTRWLAALAFAGVIVGLDQWSKHWMEQWLRDRHVVEVLPWFNFALAHNPGAAFSLFTSHSSWQHPILALISIVASLALIEVLRRSTADRFRLLVWSLILGGAAGNLIDRVFIGVVTDFIDWHVGSWHWPTFNLADSAICLGVGLLLGQELLFSSKPQSDAL